MFPYELLAPNKESLAVIEDAIDRKIEHLALQELQEAYLDGGAVEITEKLKVKARAETLSRLAPATNNQLL